jgi:hypothetical protein
MNKKVVFFLALSCFFVTMIAGCALFQNADPRNLKTPYARARYVTATYNAGFEHYQKIAGLPNLTEEAKTFLKGKRKVLVYMNPAVAVFNGHAEDGTITDTMFDEILNTLWDFESGWYTTQSITDKEADQLIYDSGLSAETAIQFSPIWGPIIGELIHQGLNTLRVLLSQRGLTEEQMKIAWQQEFDKFKTLDVNQLIIAQSVLNQHCIQMVAGSLRLF